MGGRYGHPPAQTRLVPGTSRVRWSRVSVRSGRETCPVLVSDQPFGAALTELVREVEDVYVTARGLKVSTFAEVLDGVSAGRSSRSSVR